MSDMSADSKESCSVLVSEIEEGLSELSKQQGKEKVVAHLRERLRAVMTEPCDDTTTRLQCLLDVRSSLHDQLLVENTNAQ